MLCARCCCCYYFLLLLLFLLFLSFLRKLLCMERRCRYRSNGCGGIIFIFSFFFSKGLLRSRAQLLKAISAAMKSSHHLVRVFFRCEGVSPRWIAVQPCRILGYGEGIFRRKRIVYRAQSVETSSCPLLKVVFGTVIYVVFILSLPRVHKQLNPSACRRMQSKAIARWRTAAAEAVLHRAASERARAQVWIMRLSFSRYSTGLFWSTAAADCWCLLLPLLVLVVSLTLVLDLVRNREFPHLDPRLKAWYHYLRLKSNICVCMYPCTCVDFFEFIFILQVSFSLILGGQPVVTEGIGVTCPVQGTAKNLPRLLMERRRRQRQQQQSI